MRLGGLRNTADATPVDAQAERERQVRQARLELARRHPRWVELEEVDLVPRGRGLLVSARTDEVFQVHRGVVFQSGSATVIADFAPLAFFADRDGGLVFLERCSAIPSWSEHLERKARRR